MLPAGELQSHPGYNMEFWVQGYGEGGDIGSEGGISGYDYVQLDAGLAEVDSDAWRIGLQGLKRFEGVYLLGSLHYGNADYDGTRQTAPGTANFDFDGEEEWADIEDSLDHWAKELATDLAELKGLQTPHRDLYRGPRACGGYT